MDISERQREALIRDLVRLHAEIPELITAIQLGDERKTNEAIALLTRGSSGRIQFLMDQLTDYVVIEAIKGNKRPLQMVASGEAFR